MVFALEAVREYGVVGHFAAVVARTTLRGVRSSWPLFQARGSAPHPGREPAPCTSGGGCGCAWRRARWHVAGPLFVLLVFLPPSRSRAVAGAQGTPAPLGEKQAWRFSRLSSRRGLPLACWDLGRAQVQLYRALLAELDPTCLQRVLDCDGRGPVAPSSSRAPPPHHRTAIWDREYVPL
jgi:hypothetical protein